MADQKDWEVRDRPPPRFVTKDEADLLLQCYRCTAVGYTIQDRLDRHINPFSRYGRILRAIRMAERKLGRPIRGAYKDMTASLIGLTCALNEPTFKEKRNDRYEH